MVTIIQQLCKAANTTISAVEVACNLSNASIRRWDKSSPSVDKVLAVANYFGVSIEYLLGVEIEHKDYLTRKYDLLDDHGKALVDAVMDMELSRCKPRKVIPLFPAAAGPGEPIDGAVFEEYEIPADSKADFAVRISGDSMTPYFQHGEVVLCQKRIPQTGEIAVMMVDGFLVVKQYIRGYNNSIFLRSLNRQRKDLDIDLYESGNETVQGWGTVIHKPIPLVEE